MRHLNRSPRRFVLGTLAVVACGLTVVAASAGVARAQEHPLTPFVKLAKESRNAIASVHDYEALFTKRELVGRTLFTGQMMIKLRQEPFGVYLRFVDANAGREVIYAGPRYRNQLQAHEPPGSIRNIVGTVSLDPRSPTAMAEGRHPITNIGMQKMIEAQIDLWKDEMKFGECECQFYPNAKLQGTECQVCECTHPTPRRQFKFYRTRLFIDKKTNFPVRMEQWGFPVGGSEPPLIEEYTYTDIKTNVGLTDSDFDVRNRKYHF
ncbi:MAG TPA: DUF1571 domain-containing protein [Planctomycetaceae bacterium]|jgi:hypothetical protein|nr:DUF1571 domain-containing protein [Planctomycetaceae bacterium]